MLQRSLLSLAAVLVVLSSALYPRLKLFGVFRTFSVISYNNEDCISIPGIEACEDGWTNRQLGVAYLACSDIRTRFVWMPATGSLNATAVPAISTDRITLLSLTAPYSHRSVKMTNLPRDWPGIWVHGMTVWQDPSDPMSLSLFVISHRPPLDRTSAPRVGADSVMEIFQTRAGEEEIRWVKTVRHRLIKTPNGVAAVGPTNFYVSNDLHKKVHWTRAFNDLYTVPSDIVYCDASGSQADCKVAAGGLIYPNGLTIGSNGLLYSAVTYRGGVMIWEPKEDHTLRLVEDLMFAYPIDNLHTDPENGHIYAAVVPQGIRFGIAASQEGVEKGRRSPVEAWRILQQDDGKHIAERVFADSGQKVSAATTAAPFGNKILFTGPVSKDVVICTLDAK